MEMTSITKGQSEMSFFSLKKVRLRTFDLQNPFKWESLIGIGIMECILLVVRDFDLMT